MSLATLQNVPLNEQAFLMFSFVNADEHAKIVNKARDLLQVDLPSYILDPISFDDLQGWLQRHQQAHNEMDAVLGIRGADLTEVDLENPAQLAAWIWQHSQEHIQAATILRLT